MVFSDIHTDLRALKSAMEVEAEAYVVAGDLVNWGRGLDKMAEPMLAKASKTYILPGNHESAADTASFCRCYGFHHFHGRSFELGGFHVAGLGYSSPTPFGTPGEYREDEMGEQLAKFANLDPLILICHSPPYDTKLDRIHEGLHAGSHAVREFIEKYQPTQFFCGHIHEAEGVVIHMGKTRAMNVGKRGYLAEW
jgi:uncharacterized protein